MMDTEELRAWYFHETPEIKRLMTEAAATIESLQRENEALRQSASRAVRSILPAIDAGLKEGIMHSKAEVERLQRELVRLNSHIDSYVSTNAELQQKLGEAEQAKQNVCSMLDRALAQNEALRGATQEIAAKATEAAMENMKPRLLKAIEDAVMARTAALNEQVIQLQRENEGLRNAIARQGLSAIAGMDAAKSHAHSMLAQAEKARAESGPDLISSERAVNAALTDEVERLQRELEEMRNLLEQSHAALNVFYGSGWHYSDDEIKQIEKAKIDILPYLKAGDSNSENHATHD